MNVEIEKLHTKADPQPAVKVGQVWLLDDGEHDGYAVVLHVDGDRVAVTVMDNDPRLGTDDAMLVDVPPMGAMCLWPDLTITVPARLLSVYVADMPMDALEAAVDGRGTHAATPEDAWRFTAMNEWRRRTYQFAAWHRL